MIEGWNNYNGNKYYVYNGHIINDCWHYINGTWYRFNNNGELIESWESNQIELQLDKTINLIEICNPISRYIFGSFNFKSSDLNVIEVNDRGIVKAISTGHATVEINWWRETIYVSFNVIHSLKEDFSIYNNKNDKIANFELKEALKHENSNKINNDNFTKKSSTLFNDISNFDVKLKYISLTYSGIARKNVITVLDSNGKLLKNGVDYNVLYEDNINVGTAKAIISFKGNFEGMITKTFKITKKDASEFIANLSYETVTYDGNQKTPTVKVVDTNGNELIKGKDYKAIYANISRKEVGSYKVTIKYMGNYTGTKVLWFTISPKN